MRVYIIFLFSFLFLLVSCEDNSYIQDVSNQDVDLLIYDFHKDILSVSDNFDTQNAQEFKLQLGTFFESYNTRIIHLGFSFDTSYSSKLKLFMRESWVQKLYVDVAKVFPTNEWLKSELTQAFKYYSFYFPNKNIPHIATFIGGVQYSVVIDENMLAIGLDKYLGANYLMYKQMNIASFIRQGMYKQKIPVDCMRAIVEAEYPSNFKEEHLLSKMILHGRYMYFVKSMLPEIPDSTLWGYTTQQINYCVKSEADFWQYFVSVDNILFNTEYLTIKRFIDEGPFTPVFDRESPGRIGQWVGFKIVESFMKNNPNVTLDELFSIEDSQLIMNKAKYNP